jgi:hypothetical protein
MYIESETIKNAITKSIAQIYPNETIYKNTVNQGVKNSYFFVSQLNTDYEKTSKDKYKINYLFNIRYYKENATKSELESVAFSLFSKLSTLKDKEVIAFSKNINHEIVDNVLQFFVSYRVNIINQIERDINMNEIDINGGVK